MKCIEVAELIEKRIDINGGVYLDRQTILVLLDFLINTGELLNAKDRNELLQLRKAKGE